MAPVLPSLVEIGVMGAIAAQSTLVERLESLCAAATASELPRWLIPTNESPHHMALTTERFALKAETSFPSTLFTPVWEILVALLLFAPMDALKIVLVLLLAARLVLTKEGPHCVMKTLNRFDILDVLAPMEETFFLLLCSL
jgi:hypothetical protein